ncbi:hypothetical protein M569_05653, partial [Genlisea aurea]
MMHSKSESDITSSAPSSPSRSPKRLVYYVQSPSRDSSHDGDKSLSMHATPNFNSPMESPSHPSFGRHSRNSSASRFSGIFRSSSGRKMSSRKRNDKGWPECSVILEEGNYDEFDADNGKTLTRRCQALMAFLGFLLLFTVFCLIIWGAARNFEPQITLRSLTVNNLYVGSGADFTGVPTKMLNLNGTLRISIYNPATFYGIHLSSPSVDLIYSDIVVATGKLQRYYQARRTHKNAVIVIEGTKIPLYGAGSTLAVTTGGPVQIPLTLSFVLVSNGDVVGKLVTTKHRTSVTCPVNVDSTVNSPMKFSKNNCTFT